MTAPQALIFDVFGTCVDWRSAISRQLAQSLPQVDPDAFADAWRARYQPAMAQIRSGNRGYVPLDDLHRENLEHVARHLGIDLPDPGGLARAWERLDPWPDTVEGLGRLRAQAIIAPCSNGSIALMTRLARHAGLPWDCILGADLARGYKPDAGVYLACARALRLDPGQVVMVAAHNDDLHAARAAGFATAFVARPTEYGPAQTTDLEPDADWDFVARDFIDLAARISG